MSIHATSPETEAAISRQRRSSFISSAIIGILTVVLLMLLLSLFLLAPLFKETPTIVTYESNLNESTELEVKKVTTSMDRKPSSPSASMAKVIAAQTQSAVSVPVLDVEVTVPSLDFGNGDDFGEGWGSGNGSGTGGGGGDASFFQQKVTAERIAYVIDYSASMKGARENLMRQELKKSVSDLKDDMQYQLIFFAGPAWTAGDEVKMNRAQGSAEVKSGSRTYDWKGGAQAHEWEPKGKKQEAKWESATRSHLRKSAKLVEETKLVYGTNWEPALEMAIAMDPPPQIIFFMTDGLTGGDAVSLAKSIGARAKAKQIIINTVAMMEPRAEGAMKEMAKRTGGQFSMIDKNGKVNKGK